MPIAELFMNRFGSNFNRMRRIGVLTNKEFQNGDQGGGQDDGSKL